LFGGLGLNFIKSGVSASVRTPFGSVSSKGITIRTGIKGLSFKISSSPKQEAARLFRDELDETEKKSRHWLSGIERIKRFNGKEIGYCMPNSNYNEMLSELEPLILLGMQIDAELMELQGITRQYKLGMMQNMNSLRKELAKLMQELEGVWNAMYHNKQQYLAENPPPLPRIVQPPPLPVTPPPSPPLPAEPPERVIRLNCLNCQQHIEVNADAQGQSFDCPNCGSKVDVGSFEDYQTPAVITEPLSYQTITQPSGFDSRQDNLKKTLITIGSIAAILVIGVLLFTLSVKSRQRDAAKASAEKQAEAEHQRKVDAVAKKIVAAQTRRDAEATNPIADRTKKQLIDEVNSLSERFEMAPTNFLRMNYVGSKLGFSLRDYCQLLANLEENANSATGGERQRNLSKLPKKVYPKLTIDSQLPEQDPVLSKFEKVIGETIRSLKAEHRLY